METVKAMKLLTLDEVAEMLRKSPAQMRWMRHKRDGPTCGPAWWPRDVPGAGRNRLDQRRVRR